MFHFSFLGSVLVKIRSEACKDPNRVGCGKATITVNGVNKSRTRRGYNIVVLNEKTGFCIFTLSCYIFTSMSHFYCVLHSFAVSVLLLENCPVVPTKKEVYLKLDASKNSDLVILSSSIVIFAEIFM